MALRFGKIPTPADIAKEKKALESMSAGQLEEWVRKHPDGFGAAGGGPGTAVRDLYNQAMRLRSTRQKEMQTQAQNAMADYASTHPGVIRSQQSLQEQRAGINPADYEGVRNVQTGELLSQYAFDPTKSEAFSRQRAQALEQGPSEWAKLQTQRQQMEEQNQRDLANKQAQQGISQATSALARMGGLGGGARNRMAMQGAREMMMQNQGISRQGMADRLGISSQDEQTRQNLLNQVAGTELQGQQTNLGTLGTDITRKAAFDANRYNQQMAAWGAKQTADAQRAAAGGGGKK
jgi:hypothetical protein